MKTFIAMRRVDVGGMNIQYLTAGEGPPLVLLHGVSDSAWTWSRVIPILARSNRVYAPTFPGSGYSDKPKVRYSPAFFEQFVVDFMDTLQIKRAIIVGNSLGGLVAMRLALSNPGRVQALVLADSSGLGREVSLALRLLTLPGYGNLVVAWNKTLVGAGQWALGVATLLFKRYRRVPRRWVALQYRMARLEGFLEATRATVRSGMTIRGQRRREILLNDLPRVQAPALVIWGKDDRIVPVAHAHAAAARLARGQLAVIPDCGHLPQLERPDHFISALDRFLAAQVAPSIGPVTDTDRG